jgi:hypothetical protein
MVATIDSDAVIRILRESGAETDEEFRLRAAIAVLDRAGFAVVRKPQLVDKGIPHKRPYA